MRHLRLVPVVILLGACGVAGQLGGTSQRDRDTSTKACGRVTDAIRAYKRGEFDRTRSLLTAASTKEDARDSEGLVDRFAALTVAAPGSQEEADAAQSLFAYCYSGICDPQLGRREACVTEPIPTASSPTGP